MPELPEVENLKIGLNKNISKQKIINVKINKPKIVSGRGNKRQELKEKTKSFIKNLKNESFVKVERKGKNLIFKLTNNKIIIAHLKLTGQFVYESKNKNKKISGGHPIQISESLLPNKHSHIIFYLSKGTLYYNDTRMFGYVLFYKNEKELKKEKHFDKLGLEPLNKDFTLKYFLSKLSQRKSKIKTLLLNQNIVVGIGNIYADESLFKAKILPYRIASSLKKEEVNRLHKAIKEIIKKAISLGGSSVINYRLIDNSKGNYAREHKVYGKKGEKCKVCNNFLKKTIINGRGTIFCNICQK